MPQRNERSICALYSPARFSRTTEPNQPKNIQISSSTPMKKISGPLALSRSADRSLNQWPSPVTVTSRPMQAMIGHWLWAGT
ncbi:hypothetical protein D3C77_584600 [compost metagenome]